jgi:low temperature requirement protein LtrA
MRFLKGDDHFCFPPPPPLFFFCSLLFFSLLCLGGFVLALLAGFFVRPTTRNAQYVPFVLGVDVFHYLYALAMVLMGIGIDLATTRAPRLLLLSIIY